MAIPPPSKEYLQYKEIRRHVLDCPNNIHVMIKAYQQAIQTIQKIPIKDQEEKEEADLYCQILQESINRFHRELTEAAMNRQR